jgi:hypothetical protein
VGPLNEIESGLFYAQARKTQEKSPGVAKNLILAQKTGSAKPSGLV